MFGHHLTINALVVGTQLVLTPVFFGAEPNAIDDPSAATGVAFETRIEIVRQLMASLPEQLRGRAQADREMVDLAMPPERLHPGDGRTLAGCFPDNRIIPDEGVRLTELPPEARTLADHSTSFSDRYGEFVLAETVTNVQ